VWKDGETEELEELQQKHQEENQRTINKNKMIN